MEGGGLFSEDFDNLIFSSMINDDLFLNTQQFVAFEVDEVNANLTTTTPATSSPNSSESSFVTSSGANLNIFENFDFTAVLNEQSINCVKAPIKFTLPEIENETMKITNEIIINFEPEQTSIERKIDQVEDNNEDHDVDDDDELSFMEQIRNLVGNETSELSKSGSSVSNDTCIELNDLMNDDSQTSKSDDADSPLVMKPNNAGGPSLTQEEISVYSKEGYKIPTRLPLTKNEEKILKLVKRKIRNKKSAHISRERKKKYVDGLEKRVDECTRENENLQDQVKILKNQNSELLTKLSSMQSFLSKLMNRNKKTASTAVLFVSFFITFCIYPFSYEDDMGKNFYALKNGYSRTLLSTTIEDMPSIATLPAMSTVGSTMTSTIGTGLFSYLYSLFI